MSLSLPKIILLSVLCISLFGISWKFTQEFSFRDSSIILTKGEPIKVLPGQTLAQTFIPKSGKLKRIEFLIRNPEPKPGDIVTISLANHSCQTIFRETKLKRSYLESDNLFIANFDTPLTIASDEPLCAILRFDGKQHQSAFLRFFTSESQPESLLELKLNGEIQTNQVLSIRPTYIYPTLSQNLKTLNDRISQYKPWFLKSSFLTLTIIVFLSSTILLLVGLILSEPKKD